MADKKKGLSFLQLPIPPQVKRAKVTKRSWTELNMRQTVDSGALSSEYNICTDAFPALMTADKPESVFAQFHGQKALSIHGFDEFLIIVSVDKDENGKSGIKFTRIKKVAGSYTAKSSELYLTEDVQSIRSIIQFNVFKNDDQTESLGEYDRKLIVFPDKVSFDYDESDDNIIVKSIEVSDENGNLTNAVPDIKYATVHLSRVFGVDDSMVYASAFNDYTNWTVDTADEYNEANAWYTASQSNSKADGVFTGITTFQNHVVCFKKDFMHEIYNTKNPFRIQDIYAEGAIDIRSVCDVDGQLIFCSNDAVKVYIRFGHGTVSMGDLNADSQLGCRAPGSQLKIPDIAAEAVLKAVAQLEAQHRFAGLDFIGQIVNIVVQNIIGCGHVGGQETPGQLFPVEPEAVEAQTADRQAHPPHIGLQSQLFAQVGCGNPGFQGAHFPGCGNKCTGQFHGA